MKCLKFITLFVTLSSIPFMYSMQMAKNYNQILANAKMEIEKKNTVQAKQLLNPLAHWSAINTDKQMIAKKNALEMLITIAKNEKNNTALEMLLDKYRDAEHEGHIRFGLFVRGEDL